MTIDFIPKVDCEDKSLKEINVEHISDSTRKDVESMLRQSTQNDKDANLDNSFVFYIKDGQEIKILGIICVESGDLRKFNNSHVKDYQTTLCHEFTYLAVDKRVLRYETLRILLMQVLSLSVTKENVDELFGFSCNHQAHSYVIDKLIKTCQFLYYFSNEAGYFARTMLDEYIQENNHGLSQMME